MSDTEYEKQIDIDAKTLYELNEDKEITGKYIYEKGKLYRIDLVEKFTLIEN